MWHMQGSKNGLRDLMFSCVFIDIFPPGRGFSCENIEFHFSFFESPLGSARARFCVPLRLSGATRGPLVLVSISLGPYFGYPGAPKLSQK